jgi:transposase
MAGDLRRGFLRPDRRPEVDDEPVGGLARLRERLRRKDRAQADADFEEIVEGNGRRRSWAGVRWRCWGAPCRQRRERRQAPRPAVWLARDLSGFRTAILEAGMRRTLVLQEVRLMRFETLLDRHERGELSQGEAAELLGVGERTFRRWRDRYGEDGREGLLDRRMGRPSGKRAPEAEVDRMLGLYRDHYEGFTVKHFHEQLQKRHGYKLGYTVTKLRLHAAGLVKRAVKRSAHRKKRPRRPMAGMMLHQDASRHLWIEALGRPLDLIVTLDDATSAIYSAFLAEEEGTASSFRGLREVVAAHGLFCSLYTDRGSHYFHTPKAGERVSKTALTQVGRALEQLKANA